MTCAECEAELRELQEDEKVIDVVEHYRKEYATADEYGFRLEDE